jgi:hypothetical protein
MIKLIKFIVTIFFVLFMFAYVSAQSNSTELTLADVAKSFLSDDGDDEGRKRRRRNQFGYHIWCKSLQFFKKVNKMREKVYLSKVNVLEEKIKV